MKRILLFVLVILLLILIYFVSNPLNNNSKSVLSDFAVKDTASITKIFLVDKKGNSILLDRSKNKKWMLNHKYNVNEQPLKILLETIESISVKTPVSKSKFETIVRQLAGKSVKVEIYQGKSTPSKVYYVGHSNQENTGSYMLLEGSSAPFLVHIEGFRGYLTPRYFTDEKQWRSTEIFKYDLGDVHEISIIDHSQNQNSFKISLKNGQYALYDIPSQNKLSMDTANVLLYAAQFKKVHFEFFVTDSLLSKIDSVKNSPPLHTYEVLDKNNIKTSITTYKIKHKEPFTNMNGEVELYDIDRMYGILNGNQLVIVQYYVFDPLTLPKAAFLKSNKTS